METAKLNFLNSPYNRPTSITNGIISFCWLSFNKRDKCFHQISKFNTCRELLANELCGSDTEVFDKKKLRIGVTQKFYDRKNNTVNDKTMRESVRMLNIVERYLCWSLTRIKKATHEKYNDSTGCTIEVGYPPKKKVCYISSYIFVGSNKWMLAPPLLSLFLLILRLGTNQKNITKYFKSINDFVHLQERMAKAPYKDLEISTDSKHLYNIASDLECFIKNINTLIEGVTIEDSFGNISGFSGIDMFLNKYRKLGSMYIPVCRFTSNFKNVYNIQ